MRKRVHSRLGQVLLVSLVLLAAPASAQTLQDLLDAIHTGDTNPTYDLNGDAQVDVADIVCLQFRCHLEADFDLASTTVDEGVGTAMVTVKFKQPVNGTLSYTAVGQGDGAVEGDDYTAPSGTVAVAGTSVDIPIDIIDDAVISEGTGTIVLTLTAGPDYGLGSVLVHRLHIHDNDAVWHGTMHEDGATVHFNLNLIQSTAGGVTAAFVGDPDGNGFLPPGEHAATGVAFDPGAGTFSADVDAIPLSGATSFGNTVRRTIRLDAESSDSFQDVGEMLIHGVAEEELTVDGRAGLNRTINTEFTLMRENAEPNDHEATLEDVAP
ncbi:MAG: hypothetical protein GY716_25580 [bacterium]|nr:hypothetical protein [bacterium]